MLGIHNGQVSMSNRDERSIGGRSAISKITNHSTASSYRASERRVPMSNRDERSIGGISTVSKVTYHSTTSTYCASGRRVSKSNRDEKSIEGMSIISKKTYHSTTSSYRATGRPQETKLDKEVLSDDSNGRHAPSIRSRKSLGSTNPMNMVILEDNISTKDVNVYTRRGSMPSNDDESIGGVSAISEISLDPIIKRLPRDIEVDLLFNDLEDWLETNKNVFFVKQKHYTDVVGDKGRYSGDLSCSTNIPHGKGQMDYALEGRWYEGNWVHGQWDGIGASFNGNGDFYEGSFKSHQKHGRGIMHFADGRVFEGEYRYGQMRKGKMTYKDGSIYIGQWVDGMWHGKGKRVFLDGSEYAGQFREHNYQSHRKLTWDDGGWYVLDEWEDQECTHNAKNNDNGELFGPGVSESAATQATTNEDACKRKSEGNDELLLTRFFVEKNEYQDSEHTIISPMTIFLRPSASRFFCTLRDYLFCRQAMKAAFLQDNEMRWLAAIEAKNDSGGIECTSNKAHQYKPEFQQQSSDGTPVKSLDDLYEAATIAQPIFLEVLNNLAKKACVKSDDDPHRTNSQSPRVVISTKGRDRAQAKAIDDYATRNPGPAVSWLYDIVRASIEFQSSQDFSRCINLILDEKEYYVVKAKNRFKKPALSGYRDFSVWIRIKCEQGFQHICEIQIHLAGMKKLDSDLKSHSLYEYFRAFFAGATEGLDARLKDLEMIMKGYDLHNFSLEAFLKDLVDEDRLERLASLFHEQLCEFDLALETYERLLQIRKNLYGMDHIAIAKTYDNQAAVHRDMGQLDRAMELYERCSELYEMKSEISLAATYQHMAIIKAERGFPHCAMPLYAKSLNILSGIADLSEMAVADIYNNMGNAKRDLGLLDEALALHQKSLRIKKHYLGWEHTSVATSHNNMGLVRLKQKKVDAAISCFLEAEKVDQRTVGAEHASMAVTQGNLGWAYEQKGELADARKMYGKALDQRRSILGGDHVEVAWTCHNLARVYVKEKEFDSAISLLEESLEIKKKCFDVDHQEVVATFQMLESARRKKSRGASESEL
ncbi:MAG: hypothetical protein SGBAC_003152 [Bacillariaceae sp.]